MISRRTYAWSVLALAVLLFFGLNIFVDNFFTDARLDLTQGGQYTISSGTRAIIAKLPEPVTLRFYFSRKNSADYPATAAYAKRGARHLLSEYVAASAMARSSWKMSIPSPSRRKKTKPMPAAFARPRLRAARRRSISGWKATTAWMTRKPFPISPSSASPIWNMTSPRCSMSFPIRKNPSWR